MRIPNVCVSVSIQANKLFGNKHEWPICASIYDSSINGNAAAKAAVKIVDGLFFFDPNHCRKSWLMRRKV